MDPMYQSRFRPSGMPLAIKTQLAIEKSHVVSVIRLLEQSSDFKNFLRRFSESSKILLPLKKLFSEEITVEDYLINNSFLNSSDFCSQVFSELPDAQFVHVSRNNINEYSSIRYLDFCPNKNLVVFQMPEGHLFENLSFFEFLALELSDDQNLFGIVFKKHNYYINLTYTSNGWELMKNSGKVLFESWVEGCAAAYEMGLIIHLVFYVKRQLLVEQHNPKIKELRMLMKELSIFYQEVPSRFLGK